MHKSFSEDLFTSQESEVIASSQKITNTVSGSTCDDKDLGTQTFSILDTSKAVNQYIPAPDKLSVGYDTQAYEVSSSTVPPSIY